MNRLRLVGQKFGRLFVIKNVGTNKFQKALWECECDCGNITTVTSGGLINGSTKSCGCLSKEIAGKRFKELNKIQIGENNPAWKGGVTSEHRLIRNSKEYTLFRLSVMERDKFTCQICGDNKGGSLQVHHLKAFSRFPELRMDIGNGVTLCEMCHKKFHSLYGILNFTSDDFYEFQR